MDTQNKRSSVFITYDVNLKKYLWNNEIDNILCGLNPKTKNKFWVYERNDRLNNKLDEWFKTK